NMIMRIVMAMVALGTCYSCEFAQLDAFLEAKRDTQLSSEAIVSQEPSAIKGVKWKQNPVGYLEAKVDWWLEKPPGTTIDLVISGLKDNGVNAVIIRVDPPSRFKGTGATQQANHTKAMVEIAKAVGKLKSQGMHAYLWSRIWLERDGLPNRGTETATVEPVDNMFKPGLAATKATGGLEGVTG